jgi:uncharacterized repeat protein (TIGR04076 family)
MEDVEIPRPEDMPEFTYTPRDVLAQGHEVTYPPPWGRSITVTIERVNGACPWTVEGDTWVVESKLLIDSVDIASHERGYYGPKQICSIAFRSVQPYITSMSTGVSARDLGIAIEGEDGFVMCPAWGPPTCEAAVIMRLHPDPTDGRNWVDEWYEMLAREGFVGVPTYFMERFSDDETKERRSGLLREWYRQGKPKFWEGWDWEKQPRRDPPHERRT